MFMVDKGKLLEGLAGARQRSCCYVGPTCDCKYGIREKEMSPIDFMYKDLGEKTGCPEIRQAHAILSEMTDNEYETILKRYHEGIVQAMKAVDR